MKNSDDIKKLLQKYISGNCTRKESEQIFFWLKTPEGIERLREMMDVESLKAWDATVKVDPGISKEIYAKLSVSIRSLKDDENE